MLRCARHGRVAAASVDFTRTPAILAPSVVSCMVRTSASKSSFRFADFFSFGKKDAGDARGVPQDPSLTQFDKRSAGNKSVTAAGLPPMMQCSEQLVKAGLLLLNSSSARESELSPDDEQALSSVATVLFSETFATHVEQFEVIYEALSRPAIRSIRELEKAVMLVLEFVVPPAVHGVFVAVDVFSGLNDEERDLFHDVVIALIDGEGDGDRLHTLLGVIESSSPSFYQLPSFSLLVRSSDEILLRSRLHALITQTCLAFDPERTGKILVSDLKPSLQSVLGEKEGNDLVAKLQPDGDGAVFYGQLSTLLLRHGEKRSS